MWMWQLLISIGTSNELADEESFVNISVFQEIRQSVCKTLGQ